MGERVLSAERRLSPCAALVRRFDPDRFLVTLFAPAETRAPLFALYAFNHELAKTRDVVSEPMLGQIRLEWWREAVAAAAAGTPRKHEVVEGLAAALDAGLARDALDQLIDARARDLDDAPFADMAALDAYVAGVADPLVDAAAPLFALDARAYEAACAAGRAWAMTGLLRSARARVAAKRPVFPISVLQAAAAPVADVFNLRDTPATRAATRTLAAQAQAQADAANGRAGRPLTRYGGISATYLRRLRCLDHAAFAEGWGRPQGLDRLWGILR